MDLLLNDLSLHRQFSDIKSFREAIRQVMSMRKLINGFGRELYSHRNLLNALVNSSASLHESLLKLPRDEKRAILAWLTRHGPFWEDLAHHESDIFMDHGDEIVTDTAVGEAAYCNSIDIDRRVVSFVPSDWQFSPIAVRIESGTVTRVSVINYWDVNKLEDAMRAAEPPVKSWEQLEHVCRRTFRRLSFSGECFGFLSGQPFAPGAAEHILVRLRILNKLVGSVDASGRRNAEGNRIYQEHFTGRNAWFSDSSDTEKNEFKKELTFRGPQGVPTLCAGHGKVNHPPFRIHFPWPVSPGIRLFIAYIGLKITRR